MLKLQQPLALALCLITTAPAAANILAFTPSDNPYQPGTALNVAWWLDAWFCPEGLSFAPPPEIDPIIPPTVQIPWTPPTPPPTTPIPEPSTWAMLALGFTALTGLGWRKRLSASSSLDC